MEPIKIELPKEMFSPAEFMQLSECISLDELDAGSNHLMFNSPIKWSATITNTGSAFLVQGNVKGHAYTDCSRCLEESEVDFEGEIEGYFLAPAQISLSENEDIENDEFEVIGEDRVIDLAPLIESAIILAIPANPLCSPECRGICAGCGNNLNIEECVCDNSESVDETNPFAVLKEFKFE